MAAISTVECTVRGRGGHGAQPHLGPDAVTAAASLVVDWQAAFSRRVDPCAPAVLSVGRIAGGAAPNVIPDRVEIDATVRYVDPQGRGAIEELVHGAARGVEARYGVSVDVALHEVVPVLVNDAAISATVAAAAKGMVDLCPAPRTLGGDDFAEYARLHPACYVFVGERQEGRPPYGWHDPSYDIDESSIAYAAAVLAAAATAVAGGR
jgi:amidohydrolase